MQKGSDKKAQGKKRPGMNRHRGALSKRKGKKESRYKSGERKFGLNYFLRNKVFQGMLKKRSRERRLPKKGRELNECAWAQG